MYEIQFHPARATWPVRYLFLPRRGLRWVVVGAGLFALTLVVGVGLAPLGIQSPLLSADLRVLRQQNRLQRDILVQHEQTLAVLGREVEAANLRQRQISLILGVAPNPGSSGVPPDNAAGGFEGSTPEAQVALEHALTLRRRTDALLERANAHERFAAEHADLLLLVPAISPLSPDSFVLTSPFGERISPFTNGTDFHAGVDLAAHEGTPVWATGAAKVLFAGRLATRGKKGWWRYGNLVVLDHGGRFKTVYAHLAEIRARRGASVSRGDVVGTVGSSGWSTSPHLHYEVRVVEPGQKEAVPVDPRVYILDCRWEEPEGFLAGTVSAPPGRFDPLPF